MRERIRIYFGVMAAMVVVISVYSCDNRSDVNTLRSGDLMFQSKDSTSFSDAIADATFRDNEGIFTHVGIFAVVDGDSVVIEATSQGGVVMTKYRDFINKSTGIAVRRVTADISVADAVDRALSMVGKEYDWEFEADNDKLYCSELVQCCYLYDDGTPLFESIPMNFRDRNGEMPQFWIVLFERLQKPIPQDAPGTNPNSIFHSPFLMDVYIDVCLKKARVQ